MEYLVCVEHVNRDEKEMMNKIWQNSTNPLPNFKGIFDKMIASDVSTPKHIKH